MSDEELSARERGQPIQVSAGRADTCYQQGRIQDFGRGGGGGGVSNNYSHKWGWVREGAPFCDNQGVWGSAISSPIGSPTLLNFAFI